MNEAVPQQGAGSTADTARLVVAVALVIAGIIAFYELGSQNLWLRWGAFVVGLALGLVVFGTSPTGHAFWRFFGESRVELRKVVWPTMDETTKTTVAVFIIIFCSGLFFWLLDLGLAWATRSLTGQGG